MEHPKGMAVDRNGYLLVADSNNGRVNVYTPRGEYHATIGRGEFMGRIYGVTLRDDGVVVMYAEHGIFFYEAS